MPPAPKEKSGASNNKPASNAGGAPTPPPAGHKSHDHAHPHGHMHSNTPNSTPSDNGNQ